MSNHRRLAAAALLCSLVLAACGDDGETTDAVSSATTAPATTAPATTAAPTTAAPTTAPPTTAAPTTTAAPASGASGAKFAAGSPEATAATAFRAVFDSAVGYDGKVAYLEDAAGLKATIEQYAAGAARYGGFKSEPTAITITGTTAAVTYDFYFGTNPQYRDQKGSITNVNGTWRVSRADFCSFMQSARTPCPA